MIIIIIIIIIIDIKTLSRKVGMRINYLLTTKNFPNSFN